MGRPPKKGVRTPHLDVLMYEMLHAATRDERLRLPNKYSQLIDNERKASKFCTSGRLEEKLYLLTMLGYDWFLVIRNKKTTDSDLKTLLKSVVDGGKVPALDGAIKKEVFVYSNLAYIYALSLLGEVSLHEYYGMNLVLKMHEYNIKKWRKRLPDKELNEYKDAINDTKMLASIFNVAYKMRDFSDGWMALSPNDVEVLLFIYSTGRSIGNEEVVKYYEGRKSRAAITQSLRRLRDDACISYNPISISREYAITAIGVDKINSFMKKVLMESL